LYRGKSSPKVCASFKLKKSGQSKQLPNGRKFAKSGHPAANTDRFEKNDSAIEMRGIFYSSIGSWSFSISLEQKSNLLKYLK
jgi:hypothetical protein